MDSKLTLKLDKEIIERAKRYAHQHNQSLSRLVERILRGVTTGDEVAKASHVTHRVKRLSGVIGSLGDIDEQEIISIHLQEKYR